MLHRHDVGHHVGVHRLRAFAVNLTIGFRHPGRQPDDPADRPRVHRADHAGRNLRGVTESVWLNVVLTLVELSGLLLVIFIGMWAIAGGNADWSLGRRLARRPRTRASCSR
ncbi:hypothetical protein ACRAWC_20575 [Leifsonia sp. L25]|uniref:hypothetical protein n=1 Tax=Leifsonia sp. L25 TaxID=3423957 RepID=UPI003D68669E